MAQPANTFSSYDATGNREDISDVIYNLAPFDTPLQSMARKGKATAAYTEWQTEDLGTPDVGNAVIEGDDASNDVSTPTVRIGNYCQTSDKVAQVTTIQDRVNKAGRKEELAHQIAKRSKQLKIDMEAIMTRNQASDAGSDVAPRKLRSLESFLVTNADRGATGAGGTTTTAATDGTQRALTETMVKTVMQRAYSNGGKPSVFMANAFNRMKATEVLTGGGTKFHTMEDKKLVATVSVYETDFGPLKLVTNLFQRERTAFLLDPDRIEVAYLEPFQMQDLARTGLTRRKQIWATYTLKVLNEKAHGVIADLLEA